MPFSGKTCVDTYAAAVDMMRGKNVLTVEALLSGQRGKPVANTIQEVQMTTESTYHFMSTVKDKPDALVVLITNRKANLGMGWAALRKNLAAIAPLIP